MCKGEKKKKLKRIFEFISNLLKTAYVKVTLNQNGDNNLYPYI